MSTGATTPPRIVPINSPPADNDAVEAAQAGVTRTYRGHGRLRHAPEEVRAFLTAPAAGEPRPEPPRRFLRGDGRVDHAPLLVANPPRGMHAVQ